MKPVFSGIYYKPGGAGFCGQDDIVRTPSRGEIFRIIAFQLMHILGGEYSNKHVASQEGQKFFIELAEKGTGVIPAEKVKALDEELISGLYFEPCFLCSDPDCREWHEVYGVATNQVYPHVSDCQLRPLEESEKDDAEAFEKDETLRSFLKRRISEIMNEPDVVTMCLEGTQHVPGAPNYAVKQKGYAEALQDVLNIIGRTDKGDSLEDV